MTITAPELLHAYSRGRRIFIDANFRGVDLSHAVLNRVKFAKIDLREACLKGTSLCEVDLRKANMGDCDLSKAILTKAKLVGARLARANLSGADFSNAYMPNADMRGANLQRTVFCKANLYQAILLGADLRYANMLATNLTGARLEGADLRGSILSNANLQTAELLRADMSGAVASHAHMFSTMLGWAKLVETDMEGALLRDTDFQHADLSRANMKGSDLQGSRFVESRIQGADFQGAVLGGTLLMNVDLSPLCEAEIVHQGPSHINWGSVVLSLRAPRLKKFLLQAGHPEVFAEFMVDCARSIREVDLFSIMQTTFISYGSPDEAFARRLYEALHQNGVTTFFFAEHAVPGDKLHRLMRRGVNEHDRVILVCSKRSLDRKGVLNEIEEVLAREARDGGASSYLIPIRLDDYVFDGWNPPNPDVAQTVKDRVVADFTGTDTNQTKFKAQLLRLLGALKK